jgi:acyl-homoserine lactone acylase PvdQ
MPLSPTKQNSLFKAIGITALVLVSMLVTEVQAADARIERLARSVTIYRDSYGVPHIYGPTDASCVFGYAYAQAEDNFWQVEDNYIQAIGRAAEVNGEEAQAADLLNRTLEITRLSVAEYKNANPRTRELCDAFADGLNYFLERNPQVKPRLIAHFEAWQAIALMRFEVYQVFVYETQDLHLEETRTAARHLITKARRDQTHGPSARRKARAGLPCSLSTRMCSSSARLNSTKDTCTAIRDGTFRAPHFWACRFL